MENKKLKSELAELFKMKDLMDRDFNQKRSHGIKKEKEIVDRERINERDKENSKEREKYENEADLYSIILCMEHLEKGFIRDWIKPNE